MSRRFLCSNTVARRAHNKIDLRAPCAILYVICKIDARRRERAKDDLIPARAACNSIHSPLLATLSQGLAMTYFCVVLHAACAFETESKQQQRAQWHLKKLT
jgi:hypothetical protein